MNLIFIYGPPASGKLTVATELSKLSGFPLFHNHLTRDLVQSIYPNDLSENYQLVDKLRQDVFAHCARQGTNLIFTFVYDGPEDNNVVSRLVESVVQNNGKVLFVDLIASGDALLKRVSNESRKLHKKLVDPDHLRKLLKETPYSSVPYPDIYKIDTTNVDPQNAAKLIIEHFRLK